jgi:hypothetical protein
MAKIARPRRILWEGNYGKTRVRYVRDQLGWHHFQLWTSNGWAQPESDDSFLAAIEEALAPVFGET